MPAKSEKQRKFFYAVKACKEGGKCSAETKKVANELTKKDIVKYTKLKKK